MTPTPPERLQLESEPDADWFVIHAVEVEGPIQVYLAASSSDELNGQFIAAQLASNTTVSVKANKVLRMTRAGGVFEVSDSEADLIKESRLSDCDGPEA